MKERSNLALRDLAVGYKDGRRTTHVVASNITVKLEAGEMVCLLGPNGAGKSTLMRTIAGMQPPLNGAAFLDDENVHHLPARELAKRLAVVLTERVTVGALSAYALVALGRYPHTNWMGSLTANDHDAIQRALKTVGAAELAHRSIGELSDGERQKVMVARALAQEPQVMILDEITAFLDLPRRVEVMQILRDLAHKEHRAILLSTHDLDLALRSADRIWLLPKGGRLHTGAPEDLVLSGVFAEAFASEGVRFDNSKGSFQINAHASGEIHLQGTGAPALWTERALERLGFRVLTNGNREASALRVEVVPGDGRTLWQLFANGQSSGYDSLHALTVALKRIHAPDRETHSARSS